jgi:integration host factor subunit beta
MACRLDGTVKSTLGVGSSGLGLAAAVERRFYAGMVRSELVARIAEQNPHLYEHDVEALVKAIFNRIAEALAKGDRVELRGFGAFEVRERDARSARNPKTGEKVAVEARAKVHFKPSTTLQARLNREKVDPEREAERILQAS